MDPKFWLERWEKGETGWHRDDVHPQLVAQFDKLALKPKSRILVPLCGAAHDMAHIAKQGHEVIGVELSRTAIERFLATYRVRHIETEDYGFRCYMGGRYQMLCGDFFRLPAEVFESIDAVYDRASLIALPPEMRERYARFMADNLKPGTRTLLLSLAYDQSQMQGPPFSVPETEVKAHYASDFDITELSTQDVLADNAGLRQRGLTSLLENVYVLTRRART